MRSRPACPPRHNPARFVFQRLCLAAACALLAARASAQNYDPPANYYATATGTGTTLKAQLTTIMSTGQIMRSYGDLRYSAAIQDADPNQPGNILLVYNRASVSGAWDTVNLPWNREHLWPQARQPGSSLSNDTTGSLADPHALRPADPDINNARANKPFGFDTTTGSYGDSTGGYYYPGDADSGDVARALFYDQTRYGSTGLSLTDASPSGNQMGDLSSLVAWNYRDTPDIFERRRNQAIYSSTLNPSYYTNNRNAYVDRPEWVWSVFVDQANDSSLTLQGGTVGAGGATTLNVNLGRQLVGTALPAGQAVTLSKSGVDGTYYSVTAAGAATSSVSGRYNAFGVGTTGTKAVTVGLASGTSTATPGLRSGTVTIDNLDVTTAGGAGRGANDANDVVTVNLSVLDHANASFAGLSDLNSLSYNFGTLTVGATAPVFDFSLFNLNAPSGFTAGLDLDGISGSGATSVLTTNLATFSGATTLAAASSRAFTASMATSTVGSFSASYTLNFSDENLVGATSLGSLTLMLSGMIEAAVINSADFDGDFDVDGDDFLVWQRGLGTVGTALLADGDANGDHNVDALDLGVWRTQFGTTPSPVTAVPEPASWLLAAAGGVALLKRRGRLAPWALAA